MFQQVSLQGPHHPCQACQAPTARRPVGGIGPAGVAVGVRKSKIRAFAEVSEVLRK
jgi:hypothetical protein